MSMRSDYPVSKSNHVSKESVDVFIIFGYLTPHLIIFRLYIVVVSSIGEGNRKKSHSLTLLHKVVSTGPRHERDSNS
jgi:hypothetical protein